MSAFAFGNNEATARIVAALGLRNVRSLRLSIEVGNVITVTAEQFVLKDELDQIALVLETNDFVMMTKEEWGRVKEQLDGRRMAADTE
jgi:hypothetical protein